MPKIYKKQERAKSGTITARTNTEAFTEASKIVLKTKKKKEEKKK